MKKFFIVITTCLLIACSDSEPEFEHLGTYLKSSGEFTQLQFSNIRGRGLKNAVVADIENNTITFYIYDPKLSVDSINLGQVGIFKKGFRKLIHQVKPLEKAGTYAISAILLDKDYPLVVLKTGGLFSSKAHVAAIGELEGYVVKGITNINVPSSKRLRHIKEALRDYPENEELLGLKSKYEEMAAVERKIAVERKKMQADLYAYKKAKQSETIYRKKEKWVESYKKYLEKYPDGNHVSSTQARITEINAQIQAAVDEYNTQLSKFNKIVKEFTLAIKSKDKERLKAVTFNASNSERYLKRRRLLEADLDNVAAKKFHYSNPKMKAFAYVHLSGGDISRLDMKYRDEKWLITNYVM